MTTPQQQPEECLQIEDLTLEYPDGAEGIITALDHVNLTVSRGEMVSLVGPSGSGKSSLLAAASALITTTSGKILLEGADITQMTPRARAMVRREQVGIIFQQPNLLASLTAVEQLLLAEDLRGGTRRRRGARGRALEKLEQVGLAEAADRRPHQLSGGQRQRVNIARALMGNPALLLVDEPTAALDQERSESIVRLLRHLTDHTQVATVMVTHDTEFLPLADAVVTMRDGKLSSPVRAPALPVA